MVAMRRLLVSALTTCVLLVAAGQARADNDAAAAEALFAEAKKLAAKGKYAEACPKFVESNRLDPGAGTLIHLGNCYEKNKQTASAWVTYKAAASAAQAANRKEWAKLATQRAKALEPKLAHLTIKVPQPVDKLEVTRDGTSVSQASFNMALPIDTGAHAVEATAAGFKPFKTTVNITRDGENVEVTIPKLEAEPVAVAPPPAPRPAPSAGPPPWAGPAPGPSPSPEHDEGSGQRTIGFVVGGVGVAGIAVGAVTGLMAMGKSSDAKATCPNDGRCASREAVDASEDARTFGLVSTIAFIAGGVGLATGTALVFTAPSADEPRRSGVRLAPQAGPDRAGLTVFGAF